MHPPNIASFSYIPHFRDPKVIELLASPISHFSGVFSRFLSVGMRELSVSGLDPRLLIAFGDWYWHLYVWNDVPSSLFWLAYYLVSDCFFSYPSVP